MYLQRVAASSLRQPLCPVLPALVPASLQRSPLRFLSAGPQQGVKKPGKSAKGLSDSDSSYDGGSTTDDYGMEDPPPTEPPADERHQLKASVIRKALQEGTLGLGFSAGGFLYGYHLGVLWELRRLGILPSPDQPGAIKMAGASAGSLAIATFACGLDVPKATQALFEFAADCRSNGTRARLGLLLRDFLHAYLPDDAHERCRDLTYVAMTRVFPVWRPELIHKFHDKDDLVQALITSCHIPLYANGDWMTKFRGRYYMDGGVMAFIPRPPTPTVVKVCCFPVNDVLNKVQPSVQNYEKVASLLDVAISPDAYEQFGYSYQQLLNWALIPADNSTLEYLIAKGRRDAAAWAANLQLVVTPGQTGSMDSAGSGSEEPEVVVQDFKSQQEVVLKGAGSKQQGTSS